MARAAVVGYPCHPLCGAVVGRTARFLFSLPFVLFFSPFPLSFSLCLPYPLLVVLPLGLWTLALPSYRDWEWTHSIVV